MSSHVPRIPRELKPAPDQDTLWVHETICNECRMCPQDTRVMPPDLEDFVVEVLQRHEVPSEEARTTARVLVASDQRGIPSHGVARLGRYLNGIAKGFIRPGVEPQVAHVGPALAVVDARSGLGQVAADLAMDLAIAKAREHGIGSVTVKRSNHFGIAGYYALKAMEQGMIGVSLTNSAPLMVPTHGAEVMLGTNPIAVGAPAGRNYGFLLDMATSVVPRGKLEVYDRNRKQMPDGWAVDEQGYDSRNAGQVLRNLIERVGGGILPLGGRGEEFSGYKGYGLSFLVDILSGVLSGAAYGPDVDDVHKPGAVERGAVPDVGHYFMALDIGRFMPLELFEERLDDLVDRIRESRRALDQDRIYIPGEKEAAKSEIHARKGIPLARNVFETLCRIAEECGAHLPRTVRLEREQAPTRGEGSSR